LPHVSTIAPSMRPIITAIITHIPMPMSMGGL
jgi:hypothetical protein